MNALWATAIAVLLPLPALAAETETARNLPPLGAGGAVQMLLGLGVVLALIGGAAWLLRRYTPLRAGSGTLKVVGALALSARERMVLVQVDEVRLLVGVAPGRIQTLHVFNASHTAAGNFASTLTATLQNEQSHD